MTYYTTPTNKPRTCAECGSTVASLYNGMCNPCSSAFNLALLIERNACAECDAPAAGTYEKYPYCAECLADIARNPQQFFSILRTT